MLLQPPLGLLGGTFDPVHLGHIHLALSVAYGLELQEVRFIPNYQPLLRTQPHVATAEQRVAMLKLALAAHPNLTLDTREIAKQGTSYTVDTLAELRQELPSTPLCFILSLDQFCQFDQWHAWQAICELAHLIVTPRPGYSMRLNKTLKKLLKQRQSKNAALLHTTNAGSIYLHEIIPLAISATEIRAQLAAKSTISYFLPPPVWQYIDEKKLYSSF